MGSRVVGQRYAALLMRACGGIDGAYECVLALRGVFMRCGGSLRVLSWMDESEFLSYVNRLVVCCNSELRGPISGFLRVVHKRGRLGFILEILDCFLEMVVNSSNMELVDLHTGFALDDESLCVIKDAVTEQINKQLVVREFVDDSIVGGFVLYGSSFMIDATLGGKLCSLGASIMSRLDLLEA